MEKEPRKKIWPKGADSILKQLNTTEQLGHDVINNIQHAEDPLEPNLGQASLYNS